ncbi:hypothetical protein BGZ60DRAFT_49004 [Tricladium varicosporioides]|nr:hypothetical protein BGZ60DRAFT_49004 [Hymenoscyphus varicosporioides]
MVPIRPQVSRIGIMRWTSDVILLHFFWSWQFVACILLAGNAFYWGTTRGIADSPPPPLSISLYLTSPRSIHSQSLLTFYSYVIMCCTSITMLIIVVEVCVFANNLMTSNIYILVQLGKLAYMAALWPCLMTGHGMPLLCRPQWLCAPLLLPYLCTTIDALVVKGRERKSKARSPERRPLLGANGV